MKIQILTGAMALMTLLPSAAAEYTLTPGKMGDRLQEITTRREAQVTLKGTADVTDLVQLRRLPETVVTLDMSGLTVAPYTYATGSYMGQQKFAEGELPALMLAGTRVATVTLPATTTAIGKGMLTCTDITALTIPAGVTKIGDYAFAECAKLRSVTVEGTPEFGKGAFRNDAALATFKAEKGVASVADGMFYGCKALTAMPKGVKSVGAEAFMNTGLKKVDLNGVTKAGDYAFADIPTLAEVSLDEGGTAFGKGVFRGDEGLENIPAWGGSAPVLMAENSGVVTAGKIAGPEVGDASFANNPQLKSVTFDSGVTRVGAHAFRNDTGLQEVNVHDLNGNIPEADETAFSGLENSEGRYDIDLVVATEKMDLWKAHPYWGLFNIKDGGTATDIVGVGSADLRVWRQGNTVNVTSSEPIESVRIYTVSGLCYFDGGDGTMSMSIDVPAAETLVVRVKSAGAEKVYKLR